VRRIADEPLRGDHCGADPGLPGDVRETIPGSWLFFGIFEGSSTGLKFELSNVKSFPIANKGDILGRSYSSHLRRRQILLPELLSTLFLDIPRF